MQALIAFVKNPAITVASACVRVILRSFSSREYPRVGQDFKSSLPLLFRTNSNQREEGQAMESEKTRNVPDSNVGPEPTTCIKTTEEVCFQN